MTTTTRVPNAILRDLVVNYLEQSLTPYQRQLVISALLVMPAINPDAFAANSEEANLVLAQCGELADSLEQRVTEKPTLYKSDTASIWGLIAQLSVVSGDEKILALRWKMLCLTDEVRTSRGSKIKRFRYPTICRDEFLNGMMKQANKKLARLILAICTSALGVAQPENTQEHGNYDRANQLIGIKQVVTSFIKSSGDFFGDEILLAEAKKIRTEPGNQDAIVEISYTVFGLLCQRVEMMPVLGEIARLSSPSLTPEEILNTQAKVLDALKALEVTK